MSLKTQISVVLINPNLMAQRNDPFTTGIIYMPLGLAYLAAVLRQEGFDVKVIDAFAHRPEQIKLTEKNIIFGLKAEEMLRLFPIDVKAIFIYAMNIANHVPALRLVSAVRSAYPTLPIIIVENTQAVTAYSLRVVMGQFFEAGADYVITGESEFRVKKLMRYILSARQLSANDELEGVGSPNWYLPPKEDYGNLDSLPFPAWDLFPLENYWKMRFGHSPITAERYLPMLTSRGCPYPCRFCVIPATNQRKWHGRSAVNVVDEMESLMKTYQVQEFHWEDVDATVSEKRICEICSEILRRRLEVTWKLGSGIKIETLRNEETLALMAKAGCRYISISPESGSEKMLKAMRKPFNMQHAVRMVKRMSQEDIATQACFILGFPGESDEDRRKTWDLVKTLTRQGVDEVALFIITPLPGAEIYEEMSGYRTLSELTFSPTWREDYPTLNRFRFKLYLAFLFWKLWYHPIRLLQQPLRFFQRKYRTKMEMVPYRALMFQWMICKATVLQIQR